MEYNRTRDILYVMRLLGHRCIENTLVYTQPVSFENDQYHSAAAKNIADARNWSNRDSSLYAKSMKQLYSGNASDPKQGVNTENLRENAYLPLGNMIYTNHQKSR